MSVHMDQRRAPPVPPHQYPPQSSQSQARPRSKSTFSFKSDKSDKRQSHSSPKHGRTASWEHKNHLHPSTKADPNAAMEEQQPIAAALEKPTLQSLRSFQHTDSNGNPIEDPDLSNPTRSRWERPLDTIRSFERAIDNEYRRRSLAVRGPVDGGTEVMSGYASRRSSYYGGHDQNRYSQASGYYGSRQAARDSYFDSGHGMGGPVGGPPRTRNHRMQSDPGWNRYSHGGNGVYPSYGYQQSRDTVNTNGSNGSHSDPNSADPGSDNSSFERPTPVSKPDLGEQYGFQGFGGAPILEEYPNPSAPLNNGYGVQQPQANGYSGQNGPPVPAKNAPIKLGQPTGAPANGAARPAVLQRQNTEKRKSWFKRRFSKD